VPHAPAHRGEVLHLRRTSHLGQRRIHWYLLRYHGIKVSSGAVYYVLKRNGLNRLPRNVRKHRVELWQRYAKQVPGHHVQVEVKLLSFADQAGKRVRGYQDTAIDDATRIRGLKVYEWHTQENAISFVNQVVEKFPFRISTMRTDNGHEFQCLFHWQVEDLGMSHT
jgi:hypothetical protein